ncbi:MAG: Phosphorylase [Candidatus Amesbacteria bacterium GW2011_GWA2_47_11]|uniref:Phosphorylase n=1 Tax=Candidatus Amesbacteria bacterium GW2011_GWA2_47_11 TaxID=1618357 RepID=A0A0G1RFT8_9BACT|nr:MAG: Phosphorylase [Candidatus Amesbacteria bacterium GW2011_GWA2_47_11]
MVAYFCLEYAFDDNPDFYRGGLGVLSGDLLLQAEKDNFPLVALGLYYSHSSEFNLVRDSDHEIVKIPVEVGDHVVAVQAWAKSFGQNQLLLLDSNLPENSPEDRKICQLLYDPDKLTMLKQQLILCIGGGTLPPYSRHQAHNFLRRRSPFDPRGIIRRSVALPQEIWYGFRCFF